MSERIGAWGGQFGWFLWDELCFMKGISARIGLGEGGKFRWIGKFLGGLFWFFIIAPLLFSE